MAIFEVYMFQLFSAYDLCLCTDNLFLIVLSYSV